MDVIIAVSPGHAFVTATSRRIVHMFTSPVGCHNTGGFLSQSCGAAEP